ncbi:MAG: transposase [Fusobacteriaceae bacterium]|nr:transposase [Fusobacteriaceae bacterium]
MLYEKILTENKDIINFIKNLKMNLYLTKTQSLYLIMLIKAFTIVTFKGKLTNIAKCYFVNKHETCIGKFLSKSNWDENKLLSIYQNCIRKVIWTVSFIKKEAIEVIIDDTISEKTKPSSKANSPTEKCSYHWSHTKRKKVYGHQIVTIILKCGKIKLPYSMVLYEKETMSKIEIAESVIKALPKPIYEGFVLADSWYSSKKIIKAAINNGYTYIGGFKTNRVIYPKGYRLSMNISGYAKNIDKSKFNLVTVKKRKYYVFRYVGKINGFKNVVVLITYPEDNFGKKAALKSFISSNCELCTEEILKAYSQRWDIEVFIRTNKMIFSLNKYQIRNNKAFKRYIVIQMISYYYVASRDSNYDFLKSLKKLHNKANNKLIEVVYFMAKEKNKTLNEIKNVLLKAS